MRYSAVRYMRLKSIRDSVTPELGACRGCLACALAIALLGSGFNAGSMWLFVTMRPQSRFGSPHWKSGVLRYLAKVRTCTLHTT